MKTVLAALMVVYAQAAYAQLYVGSGSTLYLPAGSTLQVDSLTLVPSVTLALSNNKIEKSYTPEWAPGTGHTSIRQVYTSDTPFNFQGTASIVYSNAGLSGNTAASLVMLRAGAQTDSLQFTPLSSVNTTTQTVTATFAGALRIGKLSAGNGGIPLPISLLSFDAWAEGNRVRLEWKVASEKDYEAYLLQRSADGIHFSPLFEIQAGATPTLLEYLRYDIQPLQPNNYYRLLSRDHSGKLAEHGVRKVRWGKNVNGLQISAWPVPTDGLLNVSLSLVPAQDALLVLRDMEGRTVLSIVCNQQRVSFSMADVVPGIYVLSYTGSNGAASCRVEKQ